MNCRIECCKQACPNVDQWEGEYQKRRFVTDWKCLLRKEIDGHDGFSRKEKLQALSQLVNAMSKHLDTTRRRSSRRYEEGRE